MQTVKQPEKSGGPILGRSLEVRIPDLVLHYNYEFWLETGWLFLAGPILKLSFMNLEYSKVA